MQIVSNTFANSADPDNDNKPSHQEIHCFAILLLILTGTLFAQWMYLNSKMEDSMSGTWG